MTAKELSAALGLTVFSMPAPGLPVRGGYAGDLLSWVMGRADRGDAWLTIMSNVNVAAVAMLTEVSCVILAEGVAPDPALLERAAGEGINIFGSGLGAFSLARAVASALDGG